MDEAGLVVDFYIATKDMVPYSSLMGTIFEFLFVSCSAQKEWGQLAGFRIRIQSGQWIWIRTDVLYGGLGIGKL